jgi:hypothetical protein
MGNYGQLAQQAEKEILSGRSFREFESGNSSEVTLHKSSSYDGADSETMQQQCDWTQTVNQSTQRSIQEIRR